MLLTAETSCTGLAGAPNDYRYVRALLDGAPMDPDGLNFQSIDSEDASGDGHAYEWIADHVGPGNHVVTLERRVGNANTVFTTTTSRSTCSCSSDAVLPDGVDQRDARPVGQVKM